MATINHSSGNDVIVPSNNGVTYRGLAGDDIYIISEAIVDNAKITIVDTAGNNKIQLIDGLNISSVKLAASAAQLTLSNGAIITINGADKFIFEISGNATTSTIGTNKSYEEFAIYLGFDSLPTKGTISSDSNTVIGEEKTTSQITYSTSKSSSSVNEGDEIIITITSSSPVTDDTTFSYTVTGSTNDSTVQSAVDNDFDVLSGTVTIPAGGTSTTFSISINDDEESEPIEGAKITISGSNVIFLEYLTFLINNSVSSEDNSDIAGTDGDDDITLNSNDNTFIVTKGRDIIDAGSGVDTLVISSDDFGDAFLTYSNDVKGFRTGKAGQDFIYIKIGDEDSKFTSAINFEKIETPEGSWNIDDYDFSGYNLFGDRDDISDVSLSNNSIKEINIKDILWNYTHPSLATISYIFSSDNEKLSDQITLENGILSLSSGSTGEKYTSTIVVTAKLVDGKINIDELNPNSSVSKTFTVTMTDDDFIDGQTGTSSDDDIILTNNNDTYEYTEGIDKIDGGSGSDTFVIKSDDISIVRAIDIRGEDAYTGIKGKEFLYIKPNNGSGYTIATNFENINFLGELSTLDEFNSYSYVDVSSWKNDTEGVKIENQSIENNDVVTIDLDDNFFTINKNASLTYSLDFSNDKVSDQISISGSNLTIEGGVGGDKYQVLITVRATQTFSDGVVLRDDLMFEEDTFTITLTDDDYIQKNASSNLKPSNTNKTTVSVTEDIPGGVLLDLTDLNIDPGTVKLTGWAWGSPLILYNAEGFSENYIYIDETVLKLKDGAFFDVDQSHLARKEGFYTNVTDGDMEIYFSYKSNGINKEHTLKIEKFIDTPYGNTLFSDGNYVTYDRDDIYIVPEADRLKSLDAGTYWINSISNNSSTTEIFYSFVSKDSEYIEDATEDIDKYYQSFDSRDTIYDPSTEFKAAVNHILNITSELFNIKFSELTGNDADGANIRFVLWDSDATPTAGYATSPGSIASFIFITKGDNPDFSIGGSHYGYIMHELGHALGIDHPFDNYLFDNISSEYNSSLYSVMAYENFYNPNDRNPYTDGTNYANTNRSNNKLLKPENWAMLDISVLGLKYGFNSNYNSEDNTYTFEGTNEITNIHDMGGYDTIDLSKWSNDNNSGSERIDLSGGSVFQVSRFKINWGDEVTTGQVITTSLETEIERFIGSSGDEKIYLGPTSDFISSNSGDDIIYNVGLFKNLSLIQIDAGVGDDDVYVYTYNDEVNSLLSINGGDGSDWLNVYNEDEEIDLSIYIEHFDNFENYWFWSSEAQTIIVDEEDFIEVSGPGYLTILAGSEDTIILPDEAIEDTSIINDFYDYYVLNDITIEIVDDLQIG